MQTAAAAACERSHHRGPRIRSHSRTNIVLQPNDTPRNTMRWTVWVTASCKGAVPKVGSAESWSICPAVLPQPQWAQIDVTGGTIAAALVQQQIFAPDTSLFRWMGSIAADNAGNMAIGYSTSNGTAPNFPSIAYAGRLVTDPLNQLPQTETQLVAGGGTQLNNCGGAPCHRWGDYSSMSMDPADDCTFWYAQEYYDAQSGTTGNWHTRIGSFKFPSCVALAPSLAADAKRW